MPKQRRLTYKGCERQSKAPEGQRIEIYDQLQPGLALRVTDKGRKSWCVYYYMNRHHQRLTLGHFPTMKVDEARRGARHVRELAAAGHDPKAERKRQKAHAATDDAEAGLETFRQLAELYVQRHARQIASGDDLTSVIRRRLIPEWGDWPISQIRKRHAIRLLDKLVEQGPKSGTIITYRAIKRVFAWGAERDEIEVNPMANLKPPVKETRRQVVLDHNTIRVLWSVWTEMGYPFGTLMKFLLLTGQRRGEVAEMKWIELEPWGNPNVWTIPSNRTKARRQHEVPLSSEARTLLNEIPRGTEGDFVFSTRNGRAPVSGFSKSVRSIHRQAQEKAKSWGVNIRTDWITHDLRRTVRTEMARLNVAEQVAERVLNHSADPLVETYNVHTYDAEKAEALQRWATELMRIVEGSDDTDSVTPVPPFE